MLFIFAQPTIEEPLMVDSETSIVNCYGCWFSKTGSPLNEIYQEASLTSLYIPSL